MPGVEEKAVIDLGEIPLGDARSILEARLKIRNLAATASGNELLATRIATVSSQVARSLLRKSIQSRIELMLCDQRGGVDLVVNYVGDLDERSQDQLRAFFDQVQDCCSPAGDPLWRGRIALPYSTVATSTVDRLRTIVEQKTRDQLLEEIQAKNNELEESLDNLKRTRSAKDRMESELNIGRDIQMSMLPLSFPAFPERKEFDIHAALYPAQEVGGDFYDMFMIDDDHLCFCVGDVSGKGVPAALFMAVTKTLIKSRAANDLSPASILSHVNSEQAEGNESCMFVTIFLAILGLHTGRMVYCNAGHNPPFVQRSGGDLLRLDARHGPVIGAVEGIAYGEDEIVLNPGELAYLYTDGITEAMDSGRRLYSEDRLKSLLERDSYSDAMQAVTETCDDVWAFQGNASQADDVTVLALRYFGTAMVEGESDLHLAMQNQIEEIGRINEAFNVFGDQYGLPVAIKRQLNLCFDELLSNIVSYGYDDDGEHQIDIHVRLLSNELAVTISDDGRPFNPLGNDPPDTRLSVQDRPIGGLGVFLVRNFMDSFAYERHGEHNVVHLIKNLNTDGLD
jgi:sigma-B regulation protein RsbU (phosphoserine phosphatase)